MVAIYQDATTLRTMAFQSQKLMPCQAIEIFQSVGYLICCPTH